MNPVSVGTARESTESESTSIMSVAQRVACRVRRGPCEAGRVGGGMGTAAGQRAEAGGQHAGQACTRRLDARAARVQAGSARGGACEVGCMLGAPRAVLCRHTRDLCAASVWLGVWCCVPDGCRAR